MTKKVKDIIFILAFVFVFLIGYMYGLSDGNNFRCSKQNGTLLLDSSNNYICVPKEVSKCYTEPVKRWWQNETYIN